MRILKDSGESVLHAAPGPRSFRHRPDPVREGKSPSGIRAVARSFQFPEDFQKGYALVTMEGQERVCVENFRGICSYTEQEVSLLTRKSRICVSGRRLRIDSYTKDEIEISGYIEKIEFE